MERTEEFLAGIPHKASFRDPAGFVYHRDGVLYRQVNACYRLEHDQLMESGLYEKLTNKNWLIPHNEIGGLPQGMSAHLVDPMSPEVMMGTVTASGVSALDGAAVRPFYTTSAKVASIRRK